MRNKFDDTGDLWGILISTLYLRLTYLSITNSIYLLVRKNYIHLIKSLLIPKLAIFWANYAWKT